MQMTDDEIRRDYNAAKNKKKQLGILAQLNCCSVAEIKDIVLGTPKAKAVQPAASGLAQVQIGKVKDMLAQKLDDLDAEIKRLESQYKEVTIAMKVVGELEDVGGREDK